MSLPELIRLSREKCRGSYAVGLKAALLELPGIPLLLFLCSKAAALLAGRIGLSPEGELCCLLCLAGALELSCAAPLRLQLRRRYRNLNGPRFRRRVGLRSRLCRYAGTVGYVCCKELTLFLLLVLALLPWSLFAGVLRTGETLRASHGQLFGLLWLLTGLLFLLGLLVFLGAAGRFFFADDLWLRGDVTNAFSALRLSAALAEQREVRLFATLFALTPYWLGCLLLLPLPFCWLRLRTALAGYADQQITDHLGGTFYVKSHRRVAYRGKGRHLDPDAQNGHAQHPAH